MFDQQLLKVLSIVEPLGRGGGLVVSVPALYSDDPSSNPAGYLIDFLYEKTKINEKEAGVGPSFISIVERTWLPCFNHGIGSLSAKK